MDLSRTVDLRFQQADFNDSIRSRAKPCSFDVEENKASIEVNASHAGTIHRRPVLCNPIAIAARMHSRHISIDFLGVISQISAFVHNAGVDLFRPKLGRLTNWEQGNDAAQQFEVGEQDRDEAQRFEAVRANRRPPRARQMEARRQGARSAQDKAGPVRTERMCFIAVSAVNEACETVLVACNESMASQSASLTPERFCFGRLEKSGNGFARRNKHSGIDVQSGEE